MFIRRIFAGIIPTNLENMTDPIENHFRSIVEQAPMALGLLRGRDMIIETCNSTLLSIWNKNSTIIGLPLVEALPEIREQDSVGWLQKVFDTGEIYVGNSYLARPTQKVRSDELYLDFTYSPLRDDNKLITGVLIVAYDVTEKFRAQQKLEEAESSLREALELAELATWSVDPSTNAVWYSDRMKRWIGSPQEELGFNNGLDPVPEPDRERVRKGLERALQPGSDGLYDLEHIIKNVVTGRERIIHAQARVFFDNDNKPFKMIGTAQDVTSQRNLQLALEMQVQQRTEELDASNEELQATNEELQVTNEELAGLNNDLLQSNEALQQFAHVASHDLKEPLRKIKTFLGRIEADNKTVISAESRNFMKRVYTAADRMFAMISGVLTYSTINASEEKIQLVDIQDAIHQIELDLEILIAQKKATLKYGRLPVLEGASVLLYQLFYNLVINALKFAKVDELPVISFESSEINQQATRFAIIKVSDNGIGFDPAQNERIFTTFTRLNSKDKYEGTGLGLSLCKKIVLRHGGTITATGNSGKGAEFTVMLPFKQIPGII
jgi:PAS domain S-box-containing protein